MNLANNWKDYEILDMADGQKLERWGNVILSRPDPQIVWKQKSFPEKWKQVNATYHRSKTGGGAWEYKKQMPKEWQIKYKDLVFNIIRCCRMEWFCNIRGWFVPSLRSKPST